MSRIAEERLRTEEESAHRFEEGQMTVELAVAFPVLLVVAVIAVNALSSLAAKKLTRK